MTGILVLARLGSKRLPQKHLVEAAGHTFMWWLLQRFIHEFSEEIDKGSVMLLIATSDEQQNRTFEDVVKDLDAGVYYGNISNVPMRELECAKHFGFSEIISIDGDDILCSTKAARLVCEKLTHGVETQMATTKGLALGMNVMGFKTAFLEKSLSGNDGTVLETGWGRIFNHGSVLEINLGDWDKDLSLRFTLDYPQDADFFRSVIEHAGKAVLGMNDEELVRMVIDKKFNSINGNLSEVYWQNFNNEKQKEIKHGN